VFDPGGQLLSLEGFVTDVTAQKAAEGAVRGERGAVFATCSTSPRSASTRPHRTARSWSRTPRSCADAGLCVGWTSCARGTSGERLPAGVSAERAFKDEIKTVGDVRARGHLDDEDGGATFTSARAPHPIRSSEGKILLLNEGVVEDVTAARNAQQELQHSEAQYRHLFEGSSDAIVVFEPEGETILDANPKALRPVRLRAR